MLIFLANVYFLQVITYFLVDCHLIVSTGCLRWILWISVHSATARREIFGVNTLRGKLHQLGSPNLQDIFIEGKLLWD